MRALMLISLAAVAASGCTRPVAPNQNAAFAQELAGRVAGAPQDCVGTMQAANLQVIDGQTLAYDQGRTIWVNRLGASCPAIEPLNTVIVEPKMGSEYCRGDHIRGLEPGGIIPGPTCFLGEWTPYRKP
jgi:hypothetical protein